VLQRVVAVCCSVSSTCLVNVCVYIYVCVCVCVCVCIESVYVMVHSRSEVDRECLCHGT